MKVLVYTASQPSSWLFCIFGVTQECGYLYTDKSRFMASDPDFVQYIADQCSGAGEIAVKKMMGDYCIYCDGILFGLICDNNFFIKVTEPGKALLKEVILRPPYDGAKDYFYISDVDDRDYLASLIKATIPALPKPKAKKNPMK